MRTMRKLMGSFGLCAAALVSAPSAIAACPDEDIRPDATNLARVRAAVVCLHNEERKAAGVGPLRAHGLLARAAAAHSADMVARGYFSHDTPERVDPFERMEAAGYLGSRWVWNAGENIGWATGPLTTPRSMMDAWMASRGHRLTLLAREFSRVGVGIALGTPRPDGGIPRTGVTYTVDFGWRTPARKRKRL